MLCEIEEISQEAPPPNSKTTTKNSLVESPRAKISPNNQANVKFQKNPDYTSISQLLSNRQGLFAHVSYMISQIGGNKQIITSHFRS